jgi:hypothetical protein
VAIIAIVLVAIGLGVGVFFSGLFRGAEIVGEPVTITVKNIGDRTLEFPDSSLGLEINTDTGEKYSVIAAQVITELEPASQRT